MVPDMLPKSDIEQTYEIRRKNILFRVQQNLVLATVRLTDFLANTAPENVIKRIHTAKTKTEEQEIITYYTLWTEFADMRLTGDGRLLRSDDYEGKFNDLKTVDESYEVGLEDLGSDRMTYTNIRLFSLANQLEKFLKPIDN